MPNLHGPIREAATWGCELPPSPSVQFFLNGSPPNAGVKQMIEAMASFEAKPQERDKSGAEIVNI
jgi:hypothetical protein